MRFQIITLAIFLLFLTNPCDLYSEEIIVGQNVILEVSSFKEIALENYRADLHITEDHIQLGEPVFTSFEPSDILYHLSILHSKPQKILGRLSASFPKGMQLKVRLEAPEGAHSEGFQVLNSQTDTPLVTHILPKTIAKGLRLQYEVNVQDNAPPMKLEAQVIYKIENQN